MFFKILEVFSPLFNTFKKYLALRGIRLHDLRHSCASLLLASGEINLKQIQDWLGHADFTTTANIYSHLDYGSKKQMASVLVKAFEDKDKMGEKLELDDMEAMQNKILAEMRTLGIDDFNEYFSYLDKQKNAPKSSKNDMEM